VNAFVIISRTLNFVICADLRSDLTFTVCYPALRDALVTSWQESAVKFTDAVNCRDCVASVRGE
jgi:hypothetical protein